MTATTAYAYIRCSGLGQMSLDGPVRQRRAIEEYCERRNISIVQFFEESHTGSELEGRTKFQNMRNLMVENGVRAVVVEKLDRLARDIIIQETIITDFNTHGIILMSATAGEEDLCSSDPTRVLVRQILGCFFEYERKVIVNKLRAARQRQRAKNGRCEGRKSFGSLEGEQVVLNTILQLAAQGLTPKQVAGRLNVANVPTRYGKKWNAGTVWKIISRQAKSTDTPQQTA